MKDAAATTRQGYTTGRVVLVVIEVLSWLILAGSLIAVVESSMRFFANEGRGPVPLGLVDFLIIVGALSGVALCRVGRAVFDIADRVAPGGASSAPSLPGEARREPTLRSEAIGVAEAPSPIWGPRKGL